MPSGVRQRVLRHSFLSAAHVQGSTSPLAALLEDGSGMGVCAESACCQGSFSVSLELGFWVVSLKGGHEVAVI